MNQLEEKLNELSLKTESIFNRIFGVKKPATSTPAALINPILEKDPATGEYFLAGNKISKILGATDKQLFENDWSTGDLSFLSNSKFEAARIFFDWPNKSIKTFSGTWRFGNLKADLFSGIFEGGTFEGGKYQSIFKNWKAHPAAFISGTVDSFDGGVLGILKINPTLFDATSSVKVLSILQVKLNNFVHLKDNYGRTFSFKVVKLVDNVDSNIVLEEQSGSKNTINISWSELRGSTDAYYNKNIFDKNTSIEVGKRLNIPNLFAGQGIGRIDFMEVSSNPTPSFFVPNPISNVSNVRNFNLSSLFPLQFQTRSGKAPNVKLYFPNQNQAVDFSRIEQDINNNLFEYHLKVIANGLKGGLIKNIYKFPYLASIMPGISTSRSSYTTRQKELDSLEWMQNFIEVVVGNIVKSRPIGGRYEESQTLQNSVLKNLKNYLDKYQTAVKSAVSRPKPKPII